MPVSGAMPAAAWWQDVATGGPAQVKSPALTVLRAAVTCQLMLGPGGCASSDSIVERKTLPCASCLCKLPALSTPSGSESVRCTDRGNVGLHPKPFVHLLRATRAIEHGYNLQGFSSPFSSLKSTLPEGHAAAPSGPLLLLPAALVSAAALLCWVTRAACPGSGPHCSCRSDSSSRGTRAPMSSVRPPLQLQQLQ